MPTASVKSSTVVLSTKRAAFWPTTACQQNVKIIAVCNSPPIHRLVDSGSARAMKPPTKPPSKVAKKPMPLRIVAISPNENPSWRTNVVDNENASASASLNSVTNTSTAMASSRDRKSRKLSTADRNVRAIQFAGAGWDASGLPRRSGSAASRVATTPTRISAAMIA